MGKTYQKQGLTRSRVILPRVVRTPRQIFRILCAALLCCILNVSLAHAIETTKASGLLLEKKQTNFSSHTPLSSPFSRKDEKASPCLKFLSHSSVPPKQNVSAGNTRQIAGKAAVPAALGLVFGVRLVLGPKEIVPSSKRVQIGPEIRGVASNGNSYALAVAAYRKCQKEEFLKSR